MNKRSTSAVSTTAPAIPPPIPAFTPEDRPELAVGLGANDVDVAGREDVDVDDERAVVVVAFVWFIEGIGVANATAPIPVRAGGRPDDIAGTVVRAFALAKKTSKLSLAPAWTFALMAPTIPVVQ